MHHIWKCKSEMEDPPNGVRLSTMDTHDLVKYPSRMAPTVPASIGGRLLELRREHGWTRQDVYDRLRDRYGEGVPVSTLEKWENDRNEPTATALARLAMLYDVSLDYLFMLSGDR